DPQYPGSVAAVPGHSRLRWPADGLCSACRDRHPIRLELCRERLGDPCPSAAIPKERKLVTVPFDLLTEFVGRYPAQPATAFLRSIEIDRLASAIDVDGLGLDLGCGDGILTDILFKRVGKVPRLVGVDIDPLETEAAAAYPFYERIHTCPAQAIPEPDDSFDYVVSNSVLEHIPDLESVIGEVARV